ncbi:hypothetical protein SAMN02982929_03530 [Saccharopolyspora kobensis]|uniref:Uncharacterized protein n=1 Tax=Saccharopolyspora kobensis TaxID=146035 RepID=A0A1H6CTQ3_9PSEU|nr:hypothetical protein [Saccharopolyspora kobensis]SEG76324.1 hypothetical protein SAMN02982929_03530 [Saccharopolyspora kobensis]SFC99027.1 hypothetical protein SAMN05216506_102124 [Saccharopolyspora kobensis]
MIGIAFGAAYAALIALLGVLFGYPLDPVLIGLAVPAALALFIRRKTWAPMWCLGAVTALVVLGEIVGSGERIEIGGVLVGTGPQWIGALVAGWPRLLVLVGAAGLRRGQERPRRRKALGRAAALAVIATACTAFGTTLSGGLLVWALVGNALAFAVVGFLLLRSGLVLPALLLAAGALLAGFDEQLVDVGAPAATHLLLWPAHLAVALLAAGLEALVRRIRRR